MNEESQTIVIFGSTGDLSRRKLIPALYHLYERGKINDRSPVVCLGKREFSREQFFEHLQVDDFIPQRDDNLFSNFTRLLTYHSLELDQAAPADLRNILQEARNRCGCSTNVLFYLALPTALFSSVAGLLQPLIAEEGWTRVVFEKPFGEDLASAVSLNDDIGAVLSEDQIFRVDHYLGKELVQNILYLRFANEIFSCAWNGTAIDHVQITVSESLGVEDRAGYYDKSGAIRDMLQNHLLQLLSFTAMEPPRSGHGNAIRDESATVLEKLRPPHAEDVVLGQYSGSQQDERQCRAYRQENGVSNDSVTETYVALRAFIDTQRWQGVPFYLRTGKRLEKRYAEIKILFKKQALRGLMGQEEANMLIIRIQPDEGIALSFNVRKPGESNRSESVLMDFCHHCHFGPNTPEAYEAILSSVITGDTLPFTRWDWLQASWRYIDQLRAVAMPPVFYPAGSAGPPEADLLLKKDGRRWL
jgi:glucose-6-phosphate 1-dehydrogenase